MTTIRLTAAQAMVRWLSVQETEDGGAFIQGVWGIFGHGNVAGMGEALHGIRDVLPTYRGQNEQTMAHAAIAFAKASKSYLLSKSGEMQTKGPAFKEFERLISSVIDEDSDDKGLYTVLQKNGWNGTSFSHAKQAFDAEALSLALSNLYLTTGRNALSSTIVDTNNSAYDRNGDKGGEDEDEYLMDRSAAPNKGNTNLQDALNPEYLTTSAGFSGSDDWIAPNNREMVRLGSGLMERSMLTEAKKQIASFCPDVLLKHLKENPLDSVSSSSFTAAVMLVDISGFSIFSGQLCAQGVNGLKLVHKATNDFLGYFVDVVYQYGGDG